MKHLKGGASYRTLEISAIESELMEIACRKRGQAVPLLNDDSC
jgi:hypothetical protein